MAKGYWVAHVDVKNAEAYKKYIAANAVPFTKFGAKFLIRGGAFEVVEGASRSRTIVLEFKDFETAKACYNSPEYQAVRKLRVDHAISDLVIVNGWDA